jgi:hypothetical protein
MVAGIIVDKAVNSKKRTDTRKTDRLPQRFLEPSRIRNRPYFGAKRAEKIPRGRLIE